MQTLTIALLVAVSFALAYAEENDDKTTDVRKSSVVKTLLKSMDNQVRPDSKGPVTVTVSMLLETTVWKKEGIHMVVLLRQSWNDARLKRSNPEQTRFTGCVMKEIWTPNTYFVHAFDPKKVGSGLVDIQANGDLMHSVPIEFCLPCQFDVKKAYETDGLVNCTIQLESYLLTTKDVVYKWAKDQPVKATNYPDTVSNIVTSEITSKYPVGDYSGLTINIQMQTKAKRDVLDYASFKMF
jgi:hypothetical protein